MAHMCVAANAAEQVRERRAQALSQQIPQREVDGAGVPLAAQGVGVGGYFLDSLFSDIDSLVLYAALHRKVFGFHRMLSKRFPYAIYYQIESREMVVYRVLDCRQNPRKTAAALKSSG